MSLLGGAALFSSHWSFPFYQRTASSRWTPAARFKVAPPTPARSSCPQGPRRAGPTAGTLDGGGMEDDDEEITAATLRIKPRPLPLSALSAFSYVPPRRLDPKEHSYYYRLGKDLEECLRRPGLRSWWGQDSLWALPESAHCSDCAQKVQGTDDALGGPSCKPKITTGSSGHPAGRAGQGGRTRFWPGSSRHTRLMRKSCWSVTGHHAAKAGEEARGKEANSELVRSRRLLSSSCFS
ncbi:uncharacterized protein C5orf49 homolog isoform X1 [Felis catus]|uniref:uncharacterized protein C5orf49 homolog isoform X1 n=1 Tax=Felis catus TaxID=9685 RepID=UPI001D1A154A|nr:uncharacterized protein C5orf49 homolog isoform X1 [Felis catus]